MAAKELKEEQERRGFQTEGYGENRGLIYSPFSLFAPVNSAALGYLASVTASLAHW
jgi:hypothetical protein